MNHTIEATLEPTDVIPDYPEAHVPLHFDLPSELEAGEPPEARGLRRDEVRLMVSYLGDDRVVHSSFTDLPEFLEAGDTLVINTSGTMNAALPAWYSGRNAPHRAPLDAPAGRPVGRRAEVVLRQ